MALDVKYLRGTQAQYAAYLEAGKLVDTTYYLIYPETIGSGTPLLYIGKVLLSESTEIAKVLIKANENTEAIATMEEGIAAIEKEIASLKENGGHKFYEVEVLPEFTEGHSYKEGDVAIVTKTVDGIDYKTAYHCIDSESGFAWAAMAGNYNASNVYYDKNIQVTKSVGNVVTSNNAPVDLQFKGKNMEQIWQYLYATEDKDLAITQPNATMSISEAVSKEVGNTFADPVITISFSDGNYEYGSKDANGVTYTKAQGAGVLWNNAEIKQGTTSLKTKADASNAALSVTYDIDDNIIKEGTQTWDFSGTASCPASTRFPVTNLGNFITASGAATSNITEAVKNTAAITGKTLNGKYQVIGWRACFYGYKAAGSTLDVSALTSAQIRNLCSPLTGLSNQNAWATDKMQQMFFAAPKGKYQSITVSNATNGAPQTVTKITDIMVEGYNKYEATAYDVWYVNNDNADSGAGSYKVVIA